MWSLGRWLVYDWNWLVVMLLSSLLSGGIGAAIRSLTDEVRRTRKVLEQIRSDRRGY